MKTAFHIPTATERLGIVVVVKPSIWTAMALEEYRNHQEQFASMKPDTRQDLLTKYFQGTQRQKEELSAEVWLRMIASTISAGFVISAFAIATILYYFLKHLDVMVNSSRRSILLGFPTRRNTLRRTNSDD
jgi:acyl-CoA reductase-like NAD-dependent aldehyde dehydrogenase